MGGGLVILALNGGSSSLKAALFAMGDGETELARGAVEGVGTPNAELRIEIGSRGRREAGARDVADLKAAVGVVLGEFGKRDLPDPDAVGHRVVFGGVAHEAPEAIDDELIADLRSRIPMSPLHLPGEIEIVHAVSERFPDRPQVACFDTAFHRRLPAAAERLPLPREIHDEGVRRFGFHGLSYESVVDALGDDPPLRTVVAHLGNGASMVALENGVPVDTTMAFTPASGIMMGTRPGDLDAGVLVYLMRRHGRDAEWIEDLINRRSGMLGVSGTTGDMRSLLERRSADPRADLAVAMFRREIKKRIGAYAALLGGLDLLVFTGGIGERAAPIREEVCAGLEHLGIRLDSEANRRDADTVSTPESRCAVRVIPTREELMIARHTASIVG